MLEQNALAPQGRCAALPQHREHSQFRFELNEDCLRKQLAASASEREDAQRRLTFLQDKLAVESDIRENLKAELRAGFASLQQTFSETSLRVVSDVRASLNVESRRLQETFSQSSEMEVSRILEAVKRIRADSRNLPEYTQALANQRAQEGLPQIFAAISDLRQSITESEVEIINTKSKVEVINTKSQVMNQQVEIIDTNLRKLMNVVQQSQESKAEVDFSVVLRAIQNSQTNSEFSAIRQAIEDLKRSREGNPVQKLVDDQKLAMDEHFATVCKLIREYNASQARGCEDSNNGQPSMETREGLLERSRHASDESPSKKVRHYDGDFMIIENMLRENATAMASGFLQLQEVFRQSDSDSRKDSELECAWQNSIERHLSQIHAAVNQCHAGLEESLNKPGHKVDLKLDNERIHEAIHKQKVEVIDHLDSIAAQIQQGMSSGVSEHSEHIGHVMKQLEKVAPISNALQELRDDMTECFAELNHAVRENRTKVDLAPLMEAIQERNQSQQDPGTPMSFSPLSGMGVGAVRKMSEDIGQGFRRVQGALQELQTQIDMRPDFNQTNDMVQSRNKELLDHLENIGLQVKHIVTLVSHEHMPDLLSVLQDVKHKLESTEEFTHKTQSASPKDLSIVTTGIEEMRQLSNQLNAQGDVDARRRNSSGSRGACATLEALSRLEGLFHSEGQIEHREPEWLVDCS